MFDSGMLWSKKTGPIFFRRLEFANKARKFGMRLVEYPLLGTLKLYKFTSDSEKLVWLSVLSSFNVP